MNFGTEVIATYMALLFVGVYGKDAIEWLRQRRQGRRVYDQERDRA